MRNKYDEQKRNLEIDEANARSKANEVELKEKELKLIVISKANEVDLKQ
jgi:hypothetical protein